MIEIQEASVKEIPIIQQIASDTWYVTYGPLQPREKIEYLYELMYSTSSLTEQFEKKGHKFILAKDETGYQGYAGYEINCEGKNATKIHKLYVLPSAQGKGVGKEMMNFISAVAQANKNQTLLLNVYRKNPAMNFYERIGFKKAAEVNIPVGNGFTMEDFVMEKNL
ncbi:N-acetyltransferase [Cytophagales bacterium WSM2-2]|nr:N-acetyltransferase [Cytophagales bacterium WSM2-2]